MNKIKTQKVADVIAKLDRETPMERHARRLEEEFHPLYKKYIAEINAIREDIDSELKRAQETCQHVGDLGMFYGSCKKCGLMFD